MIRFPVFCNSEIRCYCTARNRIKWECVHWIHLTWRFFFFPHVFSKKERTFMLAIHFLKQFLTFLKASQVIIYGINFKFSAPTKRIFRNFFFGKTFSIFSTQKFRHFSLIPDQILVKIQIFALASGFFEGIFDKKVFYSFVIVSN